MPQWCRLGPVGVMSWIILTPEEEWGVGLQAIVLINQIKIYSPREQKDPLEGRSSPGLERTNEEDPREALTKTVNVFQIPSWRHLKLPEPLAKRHYLLSPLPTHSLFPESSHILFVGWEGKMNKSGVPVQGVISLLWSGCVWIFIAKENSFILCVL